MQRACECWCWFNASKNTFLITRYISLVGFYVRLQSFSHPLCFCYRFAYTVHTHRAMCITQQNFDENGVFFLLFYLFIGISINTYLYLNFPFPLFYFQNDHSLARLSIILVVFVPYFPFVAGATNCLCTFLFHHRYGCRCHAHNHVNRARIVSVVLFSSCFIVVVLILFMSILLSYFE